MIKIMIFMNISEILKMYDNRRLFKQFFVSVKKHKKNNSNDFQNRTFIYRVSLHEDVQELRREGEAPLLVEINSRNGDSVDRREQGVARVKTGSATGFEFDGRGIRGGKFEKRNGEMYRYRICCRVCVLNRC